MAVDMAEQMVRRSFDASDQKRLVDGFVGDVGAPAAGAGGRPSGGPV